jgi:dihydropteroate synthase
MSLESKLLGSLTLDCGVRQVDLSAPLVMGILNVTPDSFSDGGRYSEQDLALQRALQMVEEGAAIIDIGGESTRPGAQPVSTDEELRRVVPVIERLAAASDVLISIDTSKAEVMRAAVKAGAAIINDVYALRAPGALAAAAESGAAVCLMHMQGEPRTMQNDPSYVDVVRDVRSFLEQRMDACQAAGIATDRLLLDPGIGFGKRLEHNLALLAAIPSLAIDGRPVLIGVSRKSMFGALLGRDVTERVAGGLSVATASVLAGARIIRTHDVRPTVDAVKVATALLDAGYRITNGE